MTRDEVVAKNVTTKTQNQKVSVLKELAARRLEMEVEIKTGKVRRKKQKWKNKEMCD